MQLYVDTRFLFDLVPLLWVYLPWFRGREQVSSSLKVVGLYNVLDKILLQSSHSSKLGKYWWGTQEAAFKLDKWKLNK